MPVVVISVIEKMKFREIYCNTCKKVLGRYNTEFYNEDRIRELLKTNHVDHVRNGHHVEIRQRQHADRGQ